MLSSGDPVNWFLTSSATPADSNCTAFKVIILVVGWISKNFSSRFTCPVAFFPLAFKLSTLELGLSSVLNLFSSPSIFFVVNSKLFFKSVF